MAPASFANGWPLSTIWSSRARKRSFCPLSRRSFGRIESPPPADEGEGITSRSAAIGCDCRVDHGPACCQRRRGAPLIETHCSRVVCSVSRENRGGSNRRRVHCGARVDSHSELLALLAQMARHLFVNLLEHRRRAWLRAVMQRAV